MEFGLKDSYRILSGSSPILVASLGILVGLFYMLKRSLQDSHGI